MKILDRYLLKSFLVTFATVFVILFFIFVLQVVWLFISELAGKDLDVLMIAKFLLFKMPSVVPLVLPLSVLLASIMTFGSLAENYEFAAMKSSGISLQRAMRGLIYFIFILGFVAFLFANNVIPYAEYKFVNFRRNIAQVKPAMAIAEGQFSEVGNYNIKVEKKSGKNGRYLSLVTIHKKSVLGDGSNTVIKAKSGELVSSENSNNLQLVLKDGNYYEDIIPKKFEDRKKLPFAKSEFKRYVLNIDLSKLNNANMEDEQITNTNTMLTIGELRYTIDSLQKNYTKDVLSYTENIYQRSIGNMNFSNFADSTATKLNSSDLLENFDLNQKNQILRVASGTVDATNFALDNSKFDLEEKQKNINQHWIAFYDKFVIGFACILMFFIGAPLGAIIRKGGLGLPIVFAILIFITFHFINTFGKKVAQENGITPFLGCWMSTMILLPLAILLTKRATEDKGVSINFDWLINVFTRFFPQKEELVFETASTTDYFHPEEIDPELIKDINESSTPAKTQKTVIPESKPVMIDSGSITILNQQYNKFALLALISNLLLLAVLVSGLFEGQAQKIISIVLAVIFYGALLKSEQLLTKITTGIQQHKDLNFFIMLLGGFPFYILFYFFNKSYLNTALSKLSQTDGQH
ncbi:YjgP/YjgQ family permease [Flavobacterium silvisoli]|uniref:YjgP/YjgQ family permease n=1 Tax=Flavobacterium silvisoli TaxID=2529433 RepID=A0A4Q9Z224_9FLAO|nr:LptF/LptG family permease [Flavobacterium silvisoli]TBX70142.1 YjgP/YjgQ family permease [Flavobacterium silvisoli]